MTCEEVEEFLDSERSEDPTNPEWEAVSAHAETCPRCLPDSLVAEADAEVLFDLMMQSISEAEWRKLLESAGQPPEVVASALTEIREEKRKRGIT